MCHSLFFSLIGPDPLCLRLFFFQQTVFITLVRQANPVRARISLPTLRAVALAAVTLAFFAVTAFNVQLARADFFRRRPTIPNIHNATSLDPLNAYGQTLQAQLLDQSASDSSAWWNLANQLDPRNEEILIQLAIHAERRGQLLAAEQLLLRAARLNQTFFARWSLVNFYTRHENNEKARIWVQNALHRGSGDLRSLFNLIESSGLSPSEFLRDALPPNRKLLLSYLRYRVSQPDGQLILEVSRMLCQLIRTQPDAWPGLDFDPLSKWFKRNFPATAEEEAVLNSAIERLISLGNGAQAAQLSNLLAAISPESFGLWSENQLVMNAGFRTKPSQNPLDWRLTLSDSVSTKIWPDQGFATVILNGSQPQSVEVMTQIIRIPPNRSYRFEAQTQSGSMILNPGFSWTFRDLRQGRSSPPQITIPHSVDWNHESLLIPASSEDRLWRVALEYRRIPGTVRQEQELHIRSVTIAPDSSQNPQVATRP